MTAQPALFALVGNPNAGKTSLFNALTGLHHKVANYPGVTVEKVEGWTRSPSGVRFPILDLPGSYSLTAQSEDEGVTRDVLLGQLKGQERPKALICVLDATHLELHLGLALELKELGLPILFALNMSDLAKRRGLELDLGALKEALGGEVLMVSATRGDGLTELHATLEAMAHKLEKNSGAPGTAVTWKAPTPREVRARRQRVTEILKKAVLRPASPSRMTAQLDKVLLHPVWGPIVLLAVLTLTFQAIFAWSAPLQDGLEEIIGQMGAWVGEKMGEGLLHDLVVDGIFAGVGGVLVFLPQILILFAIILALEDSGYMARAAFLMDRLMSKVGLSGRSVLPLLSGHACAIPGMMSTRTITDTRDRWSTLLVVPLMGCSARLPVYALLIAAFVPSRTVLGVLNLQGLVLLSLYLSGIVLALLTAVFYKRVLFKGETASFLLELPTYRVPSLKTLGRGLLDRAKAFLNKAGTFILAISILMWVVTTFPKPPEGATEAAINYSFAGHVGHWLEPLLSPIGFNWKIAVALVPGFAAREILVSALGTVYAVGGETSGSEALSQALQADWTLPTALALLAWYVAAPQCLATFAVMQKETRSWKLTGLSFAVLLGIAWVFAWGVYHLALRFV